MLDLGNEVNSLLLESDAVKFAENFVTRALIAVEIITMLITGTTTEMVPQLN